QAEDGIRDDLVTGVQTCALPIFTGRGPNPQIEVSTTSGTYRPLIYVLQGGSAGTCPAGTGNFPNNEIVMSDSRWTNGSTATLNRSEERRVGKGGGWWGREEWGRK